MKLSLLSLSAVAAPILLACSPPVPSGKSMTYGFELEECNRNAKTCAESIACENEARKRYTRPLRDVDGGCK